MTTDTTLVRHAELIAGLMRPAAYTHGVDRVELIETHISSVLLAGEFAYKVKKPVNLGFVDFSTLAQRRFYCEEEIRLNRRTAPQLYLGVVPITGSAAQPRFGAESSAAGDAIEYAVKMRRFDGDALLDRRAQRGVLGRDEIDQLARAIADFHAAAARARPETEAGRPEVAMRWARENFSQLAAHALESGVEAGLDRLRRWTEREFERRGAAMTRRFDAGLVRECHGDLHLGNIVLLDGRPTLFDAIEFNPQLHWIDVISDIAFAFMDLFDHGLERFAWRLLDRYLQDTGDYAGLDVLRFYAVYRALVRAKVARIRADQPHIDAEERDRARGHCAHYVRLAESLSHSRFRQPPLVIMFGLSGAGKTTVAGHVLERLGALRVRSDIERKRLFRIEPGARLEGAALAAMYARDATRRTYDRLAEQARTIIGAGYPAIIDAAFLRREERDAFRALSATLGARFALVECTAPADVLRARVNRRAAQDIDASDATVAVLERQLATHEPVAPEERAACWRVRTDAEPAALEVICDEIAAQIAAAD